MENGNVTSNTTGSFSEPTNTRGECNYSLGQEGHKKAWDGLCTRRHYQDNPEKRQRDSKMLAQDRIKATVKTKMPRAMQVMALIMILLGKNCLKKHRNS